MNRNDHRNAVKNSVREAADIVEVIGEHVNLKKAGTRFTGRCPFHNEKTPSFSVNPQGRFFYCFGCGESGDVFSFIMKYHHMDFPEALKLLADRYKIDLPEREMSPEEKKRLQEREALYGVNDAAAGLYQKALAEAEGREAAVEYLANRGVPEEFIQRYRLGFAPPVESVGWSYLSDALRKKFPMQALVRSGLSVEKDRGGCYDRFRSRIMFPIMDMTGRVVAFGGRIIGEGGPKYMNSPESPLFDKSRLLFGLHQHKEAIRKARTALVVEGNFDLLLLAVNGIENVVAPLGTSLTRHHVHTLRGYCDEAVLLFDADSAGLDAAMRSIPFFLAEQLECRIALLPEGHDPDSLVRAEGPAGITAQVDGARPLAEFVFDTLVERHGLTLSGKGKIISELQPIVKGAADPTQRALMTAHFSEKLGVPQERFAAAGRNDQPSPQVAVKTGRSRPALSRKVKQLVEFLILYPEYFTELEEAGMEEVIAEPLALKIIDLLKQLQRTEGAASEQLLFMLSDEQERNYVADLIMKGAEVEPENDEAAAGMRLALVQWVKKEGTLKKDERLQRKIMEAERKGDTTLLLELLREKMLLAQKKAGN